MTVEMEMEMVTVMVMVMTTEVMQRFGLLHGSS